jgi:hypothetical protein
LRTLLTYTQITETHLEMPLETPSPLDPAGGDPTLQSLTATRRPLHLDGVTAVTTAATIAHATVVLAKTHTTHMTNTTRPADPAASDVQTAMVTNQKATSPTDDAETITMTATAKTGRAMTETADTATIDMTTCSIANPAATHETTGIATGGAVTMMTTVAEAERM